MNKARAIARIKLAECARTNSIPIRKADLEKHVEITIGRNAEGETTEFIPLSALGKQLLMAITSVADQQGIPYEKQPVSRH